MAEKRKRGRRETYKVRLIMRAVPFWEYDTNSRHKYFVLRVSFLY